jgi:hypothetical protein
MNRRLMREALVLIAAGGDDPVHVLDVEDALHWEHNGQVRMAVQHLGEAGMITYDQHGYVVTEHGKDYLNTTQEGD